MRMSVRLALLALTLAALAGCSRQELYAQLGEGQVNEMVALLHNAGIDADKRRADAGRYSLDVGSGQFAQAVEVLHGAGYPREEHETLGQVFKKEGFVTTELEERARFMHALSQELAGTIQSIDGVVLARVHLSVPEKRRYAEQPPPAAASVFIKHRAGMDLTPHIGSIKALVVNAVEGLPYDAVTVVTFAAEPWPAAAAQTAERPALAGIGNSLLALTALGALALVFGGGLWWWQRRPPSPAGHALAVPPAAGDARGHD